MVTDWRRSPKQMFTWNMADRNRLSGVLCHGEWTFTVNGSFTNGFNATDWILLLGCSDQSLQTWKSAAVHWCSQDGLLYVTVKRSFPRWTFFSFRRAQRGQTEKPGAHCPAVPDRPISAWGSGSARLSLELLSTTRSASKSSWTPKLWCFSCPEERIGYDSKAEEMN